MLMRYTSINIKYKSGLMGLESRTEILAGDLSLKSLSFKLHE